ncbi:MAG TPA: Ig-like domain-containing protein [Candidatus Methylomirabilis sp.]|nr:Ig-like domain-containing protein [Candidatus Methylomirabilis sp.]
MGENENGNSSDSWLSGRIKTITGVVLALTALVTALVHFRDSIPWLTPVATIEVTPAELKLDMGDKIQVIAAVKDAKGNPLAKRVRWVSANPGLITVDANGIVTAGNTAGNTTITASVGPVHGMAQVHVQRVNIATLSIFPETKTIQVNEHLKFDATPYDNEGNSLLGRPVRWSSENNNIASVDESSGEALGKGPGTVKVTAASEETRSTASVSVVPASGAAPVADEQAASQVPPPPPPNPDQPTAKKRFPLPVGAASAPASIGAASQLRSLSFAQDVSIAGGTKTGQCPATVRIMIGDTLINLQSDPEQIPSLPAGNQEYVLHGTVACPGQTVAVVNGRGTINIASQKSYRCAWRRTAPKNFIITLTAQ